MNVPLETVKVNNEATHGTVMVLSMDDEAGGKCQ